jgi:hypothetical protein
MSIDVVFHIWLFFVFVFGFRGLCGKCEGFAIRDAQGVSSQSVTFNLSFEFSNPLS